MGKNSKWLGIGLAAGIVIALVPIVRGNVGIERALRKLSAKEAAKPPSKNDDLAGLDLLRLDVRPRRVTTPLRDGKTAELTLDPALQRVAQAQFKRYGVPEGGVVLMDVKTGNILTYASYVQTGPKFDVNARAEAPAASIFKVITASALVEKAGLDAQTETCYHGGRSRIEQSELEENPKRDKWCATLAMAMGRSLNVVFGRLAQKHLTPEDLTAMAGAYGFGASVPFVAKNDPSTIDLPVDPLEFARSAAGFWHTTLSPINAVSIAQTVANHGVALEPRIVRSIEKGNEKVWEEKREPAVLRRSIKKETADQIHKMMLETVHNGSAYQSFHDKRGKAYLPGIRIAGKTGTLIRGRDNRFYTWFVGYAPAEKPEVAIAALVVNTPTWRIKGPELARNVLRAYFAKQGKAGITAP
jgi:cell division protein FtsI/penicillin-binding protein 2